MPSRSSNPVVIFARLLLGYPLGRRALDGLLDGPLDGLLGRGLLDDPLHGGLLDGLLDGFLGGSLLDDPLGGGLLNGLLNGLLDGPGRRLLGRQVNADQLRGALADGPGLRRHAAQRFLGQLDSLVDITLDTAGGLFEVRLAHEPLDGGLATLNQGVVGLGRITEELLGGATQFVGAEPIANVIGAAGQPLLQPGQHGATILDALAAKQIPTLGIGKISNIFAGQGVPENIDTQGNTDGIRVLLEQAKTRKNGLIFVNLIDFDMLYGHRRDTVGFAGALEEFDVTLDQILNQMHIALALFKQKRLLRMLQKKR
jgi:hypothetical protein